MLLRRRCRAVKNSRVPSSVADLYHKKKLLRIRIQTELDMDTNQGKYDTDPDPGKKRIHKMLNLWYNAHFPCFMI